MTESKLVVVCNLVTSCLWGYVLFFPQSCWNCGRKATETCSGCNVARYCGPFCQHKDWENHHHVCGQQAQDNHQDNSQGGGPPTSVSTKEPGTTTSPAVSRMTTPTSSADPISSLSDYVMKSTSTQKIILLVGNSNIILLVGKTS